jgi:two-component system copper resistance phosphate regulon response regulator CusR
MKLLLVEDSERLSRSLSLGLRKAGYAVDVTADGRDGLFRASNEDYAVVILDLMLPGLDGMSVLRELRERGRDAPVLILTAKDLVEDRVRGLVGGADDYLVKPFAFDELLARVGALCRRRFGAARPKIRIADLELDLSAKTAARGGRVIELTRREYMLLEYLSLRAGSVASRVDIEAQLYDDDQGPMSNVVDATVARLRRKIDAAGCRPLIHTRRGLGYWLGEESA